VSILVVYRAILQISRSKDTTYCTYEYTRPGTVDSPPYTTGTGSYWFEILKFHPTHHQASSTRLGTYQRRTAVLVPLVDDDDGTLPDRVRFFPCHMNLLLCWRLLSHVFLILTTLCGRQGVLQPPRDWKRCDDDVNQPPSKSLQKKVFLFCLYYSTTFVYSEIFYKQGHCLSNDGCPLPLLDLRAP